MLIAHYIGSHKGDALSVRVGWALTRFFQRGTFRYVTHTEAILAQHAGGEVTIGSSTLRPEAGRGHAGVRVKTIKLSADHWLIHDVPSWSAEQAADWFAVHNSAPYDLRGALSSVLPGRGQQGRYFCTEAVASSVGFADPEKWSPAEWAAITSSVGRDVTKQFFGDGRE